MRSRRGLIHSKTSSRTDGMSEKQLKEKRSMEAVPGRQYKPRHRKLVPLEEQDLIVKNC